MARPVKMRIGDRFTMLTVVERAADERPGQTRWLCRCDCGTLKVVYASSLRRGSSKSCGCSRIALMSASKRKENKVPAGPLRNTWASMLARCENKNASDYSYYGGRGIKVCKRWQRPHGYWNFVKDMGDRPDGMTLDRINPNGNYTPRNCQWATRTFQQNNRRRSRIVSYGDETLPLAEWARRTGINKNVLWNRLFALRWPVAQALGFEPRS